MSSLNEHLISNSTTACIGHAERDFFVFQLTGKETNIRDGGVYK